MSPTAANMIADLGCNAEIGRGRGPAKLDVTQIKCLHDRGYLIALTDPRNHNRITGAVITGKGVLRALEIVAQPAQPTRRPALALVPPITEETRMDLSDLQQKTLAVAARDGLVRTSLGGYHLSYDGKAAAVTSIAKPLMEAGLLAPTGMEVARPAGGWTLRGELVRPTEAGYELLKTLGIRMESPASNAA